MSELAGGWNSWCKPGGDGGVVIEPLPHARCIVKLWVSGGKYATPGAGRVHRWALLLIVHDTIISWLSIPQDVVVQR